MQRQHPDEHPDVLVIGAGVSGSVAALLAARAGRSVVLAERSAWPREKVCGCCLSAVALAALDRCGVGDAVRAAGQSTCAVELRTPRRRAVLECAPGVAVRRSVLDAILAETAVAKGATFLPSTHAEIVGHAGASMNGSDPRCMVHLRVGPSHEAIIRPRIVIAADGLGGRSLQRFDEMRPHIEAGSRIGAGLLIARCQVPCESGVVQMHLDRGGYVGLVALDDHVVDCAAALDSKWIREQGGPLPAIRTIFERASGQSGRCIEAADGTRVMGTPLLTRRRQCVALPGICAVGDAAGYVEPFTGEGMAWALEASCAVVPQIDAAIAAWSRDTAVTLACEWSRLSADMRRRQQRLCRAVGWLTRRPIVAEACVGAIGVATRVRTVMMPIDRMSHGRLVAAGGAQ